MLGAPCNQFMGQEPGTNEEIAEFCSTTYGVTFPMFEKVKTNGDGQSPVYRFLTAQHAAPKWNFHKYVVGKDGQVVHGFIETQTLLIGPRIKWALHSGHFLRTINRLKPYVFRV